MKRFTLAALALTSQAALAHDVLFPHVHIAGQTFDVETDVACSLLFGLILGSALTFALKALAARMNRDEEG